MAFEQDVAGQSSPGPEDQGVNPAAPPAASDVQTDSSPAPSLMDVLTDQLDLSGDDLDTDEDQTRTPLAQTEAAQDGGDTPPAPEPKPEDQAPPAEDPPMPSEVSDQELKAYTPNAQRRIRQLIEERDRHRDEASRVAPLDQFVREHQLAPEHVQLGLNLMAALRHGDYQTFLRGVQPHVERAQQAMGYVLPPDLQQQVQQGYVTQDLAQAMARDRATAQLSAQRVAEMQAVQAQQAEAQRQVAVRQSVDGWEATARASDPDYARKEPLIRAFARDLMAEQGPPSDPGAALAMAQEAYKRAGAYLATLSPAPRATQPSPSSFGAAGPARPEPSSTYEAALLGLQQARRTQ